MHGATIKIRSLTTYKLRSLDLLALRMIPSRNVTRLSFRLWREGKRDWLVLIAFINLKVHVSEIGLSFYLCISLLINIMMFIRLIILYVPEDRYLLLTVNLLKAGPSGRAVWVGLRPLACWDCGFESHRGAWMYVCCECCVLSGRGLCDGLITHPEESYRLWRVVVCDQETSKTRRLKSATGLWKYNHRVVTPGKQTNKHTSWFKQRFVWRTDIGLFYHLGGE